jgi:hypothetical protein
LQWIDLTYFNDDMYLAKTPKPFFIKDTRNLLNQSDFTLLIQEHGNTTDAKKIHMSRKRGKLPKETIMISGMPYWIREEIQRYFQDIGQ